MSDELIDDFYSYEIDAVKDLVGCVNGGIGSASGYRRAILLFLRSVFASEKNYTEDFAHLSCYRWSKDENERTLTVDYARKRDDNNPEKDGVFIRFGGVQYNKDVLNNFSGHSADGARTDVSNIAQLSLIIEFVMPTVAEAYDLAEVAANLLRALASPMVKRAGAMEMRVEGFGAPVNKNQQPEEQSKVAMRLIFYYTSTVSRNLESHRLRRIAAKLEIES